MPDARLLPAAMLALGLAACAPAMDLAPAPAPMVEIHEEIPTLVTLSWTTDTPTRGMVRVWLDGVEVNATPAEDEAALEHALTVYGLKAGRTYDLHAIAIDGQGEERALAPVTVSLEAPDLRLPALTISDYDPERAAPGGYVLATTVSMEGSWIVFIDRDGDYVWTWPVDEGVAAYGARLDAEARSVYWMQLDDLGRADVGEVVELSLDGRTLTRTRTVLGHHDAVKVDGGQTLAWLAYDFREAEVDGERVRVASDNIMELPVGGDESETANRFSLLGQESAYAHCAHFYQEIYATGAHDFSHTNSLLYDADLDQYMMMSRNLDALFVVDRASGEILTRLGGERADVATANAADQWSHAHMSQAWDGGFTVFDNGDHRGPERSRVSEYAYDPEAGTLELVWSWSDPEGLFNAIFGDVEKLGDTYMTTWTGLGLMQEIAVNGDVVWRAEAEIGYAWGRGRWVKDLYTLETASP